MPMVNLEMRLMRKGSFPNDNAAFMPWFVQNRTKYQAIVVYRKMIVKGICFSEAQSRRGDHFFIAFYYPMY